MLLELMIKAILYKYYICIRGDYKANQPSPYLLEVYSNVAIFVRGGPLVVDVLGKANRTKWG